MKRREFIALLGSAAAALPLAAAAQPKIPRIGFMGNSTAALEANLLDAFREGLRELGYEEGRNIVIEYRWANGKYDHFPVLVAELIAAKVDAIVTAGTPAALAVKNATTTVPLVMVAVGDPIGTGLVPSLARPGGNLTGLSSVAPDLEGKRLQLLREVTPALSHVAMFINSLNPFHISSMEQARAAAQAMGIKLRPHDIRKSEDLDDAFAEGRDPQVAVGVELDVAELIVGQRVLAVGEDLPGLTVEEHHAVGEGCDRAELCHRHGEQPVRAHVEAVDMVGWHRRVAHVVDQPLAVLIARN
jgi:putative ABC transport system substrate-binding protein